jgi:hypothetical protein
MKERMTAASQLVRERPRRLPLTKLPKPVPGPVLTGAEKALGLSQLTQELEEGQ